MSAVGLRRPFVGVRADRRSLATAHQGVDLVEGGPIARGPGLPELRQQGDGQLAFQDAVGTPEIGRVFADVQPLVAPCGFAQRLDLGQYLRMMGHCDQQA